MMRRWSFVCHCDRQSNHWHQSRSDSRTDHFFQTHSHYCVLFCLSLCNSLIQKHFFSTLPPSNSDWSDLLYTAAERRNHQICLDDQDTAAPAPHVSLSCCCQTVWGFCSLCSYRLSAGRNLMRRTNTHWCYSHWFIIWWLIDTLIMTHEWVIWPSENSWMCAALLSNKMKNTLTPPWAWFQVLDSSRLHSENRGLGKEYIIYWSDFWYIQY